MSVEVSCPFCSKTFTIEKEHLGQVVQCPFCNGEVYVEAALFSRGNEIPSPKMQTHFRNFAIGGVVVLVVLMSVLFFLSRGNETAPPEEKETLHEINSAKLATLKEELNRALLVKDWRNAKVFLRKCVALSPSGQNEPIFINAATTIEDLKNKEKEQLINADERLSEQTNIIKDVDHMTGVAVYKPQNWSREECKADEGGECSIGLRIFENRDKSLSLYLSTRYYRKFDLGDPWIFYNEVHIKAANGKEVIFYIKFSDKNSDIGSTGIWETAVFDADKHVALLSEIVESDVVYVRFSGKRIRNFKMTPQQLSTVRAMLAKYDRLQTIKSFE